MYCSVTNSMFDLSMLSVTVYGHLEGLGQAVVKVKVKVKGLRLSANI